MNMILIKQCRLKFPEIKKKKLWNQVDLSKKIKKKKPKKKNKKMIKKKIKKNKKK